MVLQFTIETSPYGYQLKMRLWDLPGPLRFVDAVDRSLRNGINVVARFPDEMPSGFTNALMAKLDHVLDITRFSAGGSPFKSLCNRYAPSASVHEDDLGVICEYDAFRGRLIWLDNLTAINWLEWRDFLVRYAHACRSVSTLGRTVFVAPLEGAPPGDPPSTDVSVSVHDWNNVLDEMDILIWAYDRLLRGGVPKAETVLLATTVARVAAWDFETAERLVAEEINVILAPYEMLRSVAWEKGWTTATPPEWELGTASGSGAMHAALAALDNPPREIDRRLWSAQASVLLPRIESWRSAIVQRKTAEIRRHLRHDGLGSKNPHDLEIGELHSIVQRRGASRALRRSVYQLRTARNALAHLEPLRPRAALDLVRRNSF